MVVGGFPLELGDALLQVLRLDLPLGEALAVVGRFDLVALGLLVVGAQLDCHGLEDRRFVVWRYVLLHAGFTRKLLQLLSCAAE